MCTQRVVIHVPRSPSDSTSTPYHDMAARSRGGVGARNLRRVRETPGVPPLVGRAPLASQSLAPCLRTLPRAHALMEHWSSPAPPAPPPTDTARGGG